MKNFFKIFFASLLAIIVSLLLIVIIGVGIISSAGADKEVKVEDKTILKIQLSKPIADRGTENPFADINPGFMPTEASTMGLNKILKNIKKAKTDDRIKGIYLNLNGITGGQASLQEIRNALLDFKESEKFIFSYADVYTQSSYYLASVADSVFIQPTGSIMHTGLSAQVMFFKEFLEKWGVKPVVIRHGKFKAAVEPFLDNKMSEANREQILSYMGALWKEALKAISKSRKIDISELNALADSLKVVNPASALKHNFIDGLIYEDELIAKLKVLTDVEEDKELKTISLEKYFDAKIEKDDEEKRPKDRIAVIYATGEIITGKGSDYVIGSATIANEIREARKDKKIKAIVLRVNSPGGSALASDIIWREMVLAKKEKPVIASMGDVAASGGYYISCAADTIVASPSTITGSIGVFGLMFNMKELVNEKIGIQTETVKTNEFSDAMSPFKDMTEFERMKIQNEIENVYDTFITHVAEGRGMSKADVDSIGQGRVWAGADALKIGLVDVFGGLDKAIEIAAEKAKLEKYRIKELPLKKDFFQQLMEEFSVKMENRIIENKLGKAYIYYDNLEKILNIEGVQARMPYSIIVN